MMSDSKIDRMTRLRVMMIGPYPRSPDRIDGGAASALTYLSQALVAEPGVELVGVRIAADGDGPRRRVDFGWPMADLSLGSLGLSTLFWRQRRQLEGLLQQYRPNIVHGQGVDLAGFLAVRCGLPAVVTVHGIPGEETKYQSDGVSRARAMLTSLLIERFTVRRAVELISISPYVTEHYGRRVTGRVHEIPNAIASSYFGVRRAPERGRLLFAGRIIKRKGVLDLIRAVARNPGTVSKIVLAGNAPDRAYESAVRQEVDQSGLAGRVEFAGLLDDAALLDQFARAEALVLPSYQETAPMVVQQAMAAGLTVVASKICGVPYQVQHDATGLLFDAGDVDQLAALLRRLGDDPSLSQRLGDAAKSMAIARYHASTVARATCSTYRTVLARSQVRV